MFLRKITIIHYPLVVVNDSVSSPILISSCIPQESFLGPLLFSIYLSVHFIETLNRASVISLLMVLRCTTFLKRKLCYANILVKEDINALSIISEKYFLTINQVRYDVLDSYKRKLMVLLY